MRVFYIMKKTYRLVCWIVLFLSLLIVYIHIATDVIPRESFYHADALYIPSLYEDMLSDYSLSGWSLQPAPSFFPDVLLYALLRTLLPNFHLAITLYGITQSVLFIIAVLCLSNAAFGRRNHLKPLILLIGSVFFLLIATGKFPALMAILQSGHHFGATLMLLVSLISVLRIVERDGHGQRPSRVMFVFLGLLSWLTLVSDAIFLVQFTVPVLASLLILLRFSYLSKRIVALLSLALLLPIPCGYLADEFFLRYWKPRFSSPPESFAQSVKIVARTFSDITVWREEMWWPHEYSLLLKGGWLVFMGAALLALIALHRQHRVTGHTQRPQARVLLLLTFFLASSMINIAAALLTGNSAPRYFIPTLVIPLFFGWPFVLASLSRFSRYLESSWGKYALFGVACLLIPVSGMGSSLANIASLKRLTDYYPGFMKCLDRNTASRDLTYGLAHYWKAKPVSMLSKNNQHVAQVHHGQKQLIADFWINNQNWYQHQFQYIITDPAVNLPRTIDAAKVIQRYGEPADIFVCGTKRIFVYNRPQDSAFQQQQLTSVFPVEYTASELPSEIGTIAGESRIAQPSDPRGCVTYGPYLALRPGDYAFEIHYYAQKDNSGMGAGKWDIINHTSDTIEKRSLLKGHITQDGEQVLSGKFKVRRPGLAEIRTYYKGRGIFRIDRIRVNRIK